jgi:tRNA (adenine22-N1)-methyltransferase
MEAHEADTVVIAGMGGLLIKSILEKADLKEGTTLILQPMLAQKELREYLYANGISITDEYLAKEDNKIYNIFVAKVGYKTEYTLDDILIGRNVCQNSPDLFGFYKDKEVAVRNKILGGLNNAKVKDEDAIESVTKELERWLEYEDK